VARYRLRFVLQEFDLPVGVTVIGRSHECHLTIEDPLVSRHHARIVIDDQGAYVEDLGSRNGVQVDGVVIRGPTPLRDGTRVRVGAQDFLFCAVGEEGRTHSNITGKLRLCGSCQWPYPREAPTCPNCEASGVTDENTQADAAAARHDRVTDPSSARSPIEVSPADLEPVGQIGVTPVSWQGAI
jgi:predicted component of type VI protein secretion system